MAPAPKPKPRPKRESKKLHGIALFALASFQLFIAVLMILMAVIHAILYGCMQNGESTDMFSGRELVMVLGNGYEIVTAALRINGTRRSGRNKSTKVQLLLNSISSILDVILMIYAAAYLIPKDYENYDHLKRSAAKILFPGLILIIALYLLLAFIHGVSCVIWIAYVSFCVAKGESKRATGDKKLQDTSSGGSNRSSTAISNPSGQRDSSPTKRNDQRSRQENGIVQTFFAI